MQAYAWMSALSRLRLVCPAAALLASSLAAGPASSAAHGSPGFLSAGPENTAVRIAEYRLVRHVSRSRGSDSRGDGSRQRPWASLGHALGQITAAGPSRRAAILVAGGTYAGPTVQMKPWIDLFGGYEPAQWTRDVSSNRTLLDGEDQRRVVVGADNARLDGFAVVRGRVRGRGAAVLCEGVSPALANNVFAANVALGPTPWNPASLHELAHDGGAVACIDGASPKIEHNLFASNRTEIGRGGAIACHLRASPAISANVFVANQSGVADPKRSSDGGALSVFEYSNPEIRGNVIVRNRALNQNDSGGIFVALWSSPLIEGNLVVGNEGGDDGGGLFVGGQEHRYGRPLDPLPPADRFLVKVLRNLFAGNEHRGGGARGQVSGAMRITMQARVLFENNIVVDNPGGVYLQRSELVLRNNTILDDLRHIEEMEGLGRAVIVNSILRGALTIQTGASITFCNVKGEYPGEGNFEGDPAFLDDGLTGTVVSAKQEESGFTTSLATAGRMRPHEFAGRAIRIGESWSVVKDNDERTLTAWGAMVSETASGGARAFRILPTYRLGPSSPCIDRGTNSAAAASDFGGNPRPLRGGISTTVDVGAHERDPKAGGK